MSVESVTVLTFHCDLPGCCSKLVKDENAIRITGMRVMPAEDFLDSAGWVVIPPDYACLDPDEGSAKSRHVCPKCIAAISRECPSDSQPVCWNLNRRVTATMTEQGFEMLVDYYRSESAVHKACDVADRNKVTLPMWELMAIFGREMVQGNPSTPLEMDVQFQGEELS